eukprot:4547273-Prymnesium_polylepis.1
MESVWLVVVVFERSRSTVGARERPRDAHESYRESALVGARRRLDLPETIDASRTRSAPSTPLVDGERTPSCRS